MKFLLMGDFHRTIRTPRCRKDDYAKTQDAKETFIQNLADTHMVAAILQPGDFFDRPTEPYDLINHIILKYSKPVCPVPVAAVFGQHDLLFHSMESKEQTPLWNLALHKVVHLLPAIPWKIAPDVHIYGSSWNEEIPEIQDLNACNILLTHRMIIGSEESKLWAGQKDYTVATELLRKYKFDLIVSGDNHRRFVADIGFRHLVNCGCIFRKSMDLANHIPAVYLYDTDTKDLEEFLVPIEPANEVMGVKEHIKEKEVEERFLSFVEGLRDADESFVDFLDNIKSILKDNPVSEEVINIIEGATGYVLKNRSIAKTDRPNGKTTLRLRQTKGSSGKSN